MLAEFMLMQSWERVLHMGFLKWSLKNAAGNLLLLDI
jgi:hypothetical protein